MHLVGTHMRFQHVQLQTGQQLARISHITGHPRVSAGQQHRVGRAGGFNDIPPGAHQGAHSHRCGFGGQDDVIAVLGDLSQQVSVLQVPRGVHDDEVEVQPPLVLRSTGFFVVTL